MFLQVRLANGDLVNSDDAGLSNAAPSKQEITFDASGSLENIYLRTDFDASNPFSVITVGEQNNAFWSSAVKHGDMHFTGVTTFMPGNAYANRFSVTAGANQQGSGFVDFQGGIRHTKNLTYAGANQAFLSNVATLFTNGNNPVANITSYSTFGITNNGTQGLIIGLNTPANTTLDTYIGSEATVGGSLESLANASTSGNASQNWSNVSIGVERDHVVNLGNSTLFMGNLANANVYTNVYDKATESDAANNSGDGTIFGTGNRPLERLTVDGAITFGARHTPEDLLVNGTIFYDAGSNKLKGIQGNAVVDLIGTTVATLDLGSGGRALASLSGNTTFLKQLATTAGNVTGIDVNADSGSVGSTLINLGANVEFIRDQISATGNISYNSTTGVISESLTTTDITEGDNLYFTDERVDDRVASLLVGGDNVTITYDDGNGTLTIDADLDGDITGVTAGDGLTGGGTTGAVTLDIGAGTGITVNADDIAISDTGVTAATYGTASQTPTFTVNAQGQITSANQQNISITASQVSDFSEALDDRVSNLIAGGSNINVTYDDANNVFTIDAVDQGDVNSIIAGNGLTGGGSSGDITVAIDYADTWKGNIIPDTNVAYDLGSASARWNDLYLSGNTIFLGAGNVHTDGTNLKFNGSNVFVSGTGGFDTGDLTEGTNLYFTPARVRSNISATTGSAGYNSSTGVFTIPSSTDHVSEGTNLYYTDARADARATLRINAANTNNISEGSTNLYYTTARANSAILDYDGDISPANANITGTLIASGLTYPTSDGNVNQVLTTDGSGALSFTDVSAIGGTITGVTAGDGLTGGGVTGTVTVNVVGGYGITANADDIQLTNSEVQAQANIAIGNNSTTNLSEGTNLYFTNERVDDRVANLIVAGVNVAKTYDDANGTLEIRVPYENIDDRVGNILQGSGNINVNYDDANATITISESLTTTDITEGNNLYFTNARSRSAISVSGDLSYDSGTGVISYTRGPGDITAVTAGNGLTGGATSGVANLNVGAGTGITVNADNIAVNMGAFSTSNLSEGTNLYYTDARAQAVSINNVVEDTTPELGGSLRLNGYKIYDTNEGSTVHGMDMALDTNSIGLGSATNLKFVIDGDNNGTTNYFGVYSNKAITDGTLTDSNYIFKINETGNVQVTGAIGTTDSNADIGTSGTKFRTVYATTFSGTATSAQYADLAENYQADKNYAPGTVVEFGGTAEVTISSKESSPAVAGVVSTDPAHLMNSGLEGDGVVAVALRGRVPCKVYGPVRKGDVLIASEKPGLAKAAPFRGYQTPAACIIGKAISEHRGMAEGVVEILE